MNNTTTAVKAAGKPAPPSRAPARVTRTARIRWVPIAMMEVSPAAQRELKQFRVDHLVAHLDLEQIGAPTVNERDGVFYIIDGQHRIAALIEIGWGDQQIQCFCYDGLTEAEEAEVFLKLNDTLAVSAFDKFTVGVVSGRETESDINRIVRSRGLTISRNRSTGNSVSAVGTLTRIYKRAGAGNLARTLQLIVDSYGDAGLEAPVLDGISLLCQRYGADLEDVRVVEQLSTLRGGVNGLLNKSETIRRTTGNAKGHCVAAAAVDVINRGKGGRKLPSWWKSGDVAYSN